MAATCRWRPAYPSISGSVDDAVTLVIYGDSATIGNDVHPERWASTRGRDGRQVRRCLNSGDVQRAFALFADSSEVWFSACRYRTGETIDGTGKTAVNRGWRKRLQSILDWYSGPSRTQIQSSQSAALVCSSLARPVTR